jgi:hypothetical protein
MHPTDTESHLRRVGSADAAAFHGMTVSAHDGMTEMTAPNPPADYDAGGYTTSDGLQAV